MQEQLGVKQEPAAELDTDEETEEEEEAPAAPKFNPFDLLTDDEDAAPASDEAQSDEADEQQQQQQQPVQLPQPASASSTGSNASKKKKTKQKKKQAGKQKAAAAAGAADSGPEQQQDEEDIDALLQQLNMAPAAAAAAAAQQPASTAAGASSSSSSSAAKQLLPLLGVDPRRIRGDAELRRMFGAGVVHAVDREQAGGDRRGRGGGATASARAAVRRRQLKKCLLVTPAEHWPNVDSGISMSQTGSAPDGSPLFCYVWSPNYAAAQRVFEQAQASYDPNAVAAVLHQFPYHVDSLLAMNELYRSMGEAQAAEDLLHRALYALEAAWPHGFDPVAAAVRLDIEKPENKGLFVALFRHAQALSRRGCHGSALEATKLLLALDPEDPLGGLLLLDYLALRAGSYEYLERFVAEFDSSHALALLPNYAFALPLARFRLEQQQQQAAGASSDQQGSSSSSKVPPVSSYTLLAQALLLHPRVLVELMAKLGAQGVGKDAAWQSLLARKLFAKAGDHGSESLAHLVSLFVERSHSLWKAQDVQAWLKTAAEAAADVADGKPRSSSSSSSSSSGLPPSSSRVRPDDVEVYGSAADWARVAAESFPGGGRNEWGHLRLADFSDAVNALPQEEMQAAMAPGQGMNDAAAVEALNDMLLQEQLAAAQRQQQQQGGPAMSEEQLRGTNPLLMLLQSMLPWVNAGQQPDYAADDGSGGQQQQGPGGGGQQ
uniref:Transcription factor 25 n=1 Tax=Tetradesmus obliquus TaxID=3088 RepID=A0A383V684_TETOB|eukprot:jgi/Sobl393_1/15567/SZX61117.1